jgi:hypothetical protein
MHRSYESLDLPLVSAITRPRRQAVWLEEAISNINVHIYIVHQAMVIYTEMEPQLALTGIPIVDTDALDEPVIDRI